MDNLYLPIAFYTSSDSSTGWRKPSPAATSTALSNGIAESIVPSNTQCNIGIGDIVGLIQPDGVRTRFAKVSELCPFHNDQYAVVCVWLYTRQEIGEVMDRHNGLDCISSDEIPWNRPHKLRPITQNRCGADEYLLSTKRTIALWDATTIKRAPDFVAENLCQNSIFNISPSEPGICDVNDPVWRWVKNILTLRPARQSSSNLSRQHS